MEVFGRVGEDHGVQGTEEADCVAGVLQSGTKRSEREERCVGEL